jgi:uncharacterized protein (DUF1810 family)
MSGDQTDPFNLCRFVSAQKGVFDVALAELKAGCKESHWMWFIFPQLEGLGYSSTARKYAIRNLEEARAYLQNSVLGPRLIECCRALLSVNGKSAPEIMGHPDDLKLRSSMTLFSLATGSRTEFEAVLKKYFDGVQDARTIELLRAGSDGGSGV